MKLLKTLKFIFVCVLILQTQNVFASDKTRKANEEMLAFIRDMPKTELHLHIEGSLSPKTVSQLARDNKLDYFQTSEEVVQSIADREPGLNGFLSHYYKALKVLKTEDDFYTATYDLIETLHNNNIVYAELFFDPQEHTSRNIPFKTFFSGIDRGREQAEIAFGVKVNLIMCLNRNLSQDSAFEMLEQARPFKQKIIGFGMDSGPEYGNPPIKFTEVFAQAREEGYRLTGHHDVHVQDSVKHIWQSINILKLDRIDHGLDATNDPELMHQLHKRNICLTGSPVKRTTDPEPQDLGAIKILLQNNVCVSIHSDDPGQFESGYLTNMMVLVQKSANFTKTEMTQLMLNAFKAVWLPELEKQEYIDKLKLYAKDHDVDLLLLN